jgi:hypothetical protein
MRVNKRVPYIVSESYVEASLHNLVDPLSFGLQEVAHELGKLYLELRD